MHSICAGDIKVNIVDTFGLGGYDLQIETKKTKLIIQ